MKKRWIPLLLCLTLLLCLAPGVSAAEPKIVDNAALLSQKEVAALEAKAQALAEDFQMDVVIVTVWSLDGKSSEAYADDYFDYNGYGIGGNRSGVLLLLSMEYRDWAISTCGDTIYALTDYGIASVFSEIAWYLSEDEFYSAFDAYLDALRPYFQAYADGDPIDGGIFDYNGPGSYEPGTREDVVYNIPENRITTGVVVKRLLIALVIGAAVAAVVVLLIMRSTMNTARPQSGAGTYLKEGSFDLRRRQDIFLYSNVTKTHKPENHSGGGGHRGGGSSIHTSSSGASHGGGHGKF